jgi:hypothetical protein
VYVTAAAALLAQYPESIVGKVCDPIRGLPIVNKFLPAIAEIREACEREMIWHYAVERRESVRRETLALRDREVPKPSAESAARVNAMAAKLRADLAPTKELTPEARLKRLDEIAEDYARNPPALNTRDFAKYLDKIVEAARPPMTEER